MIILQYLGGFLGAALTSYSVTSGYRLANRISMVERSSCNSCRTALPWPSLIPVVGYALCRGRCTVCKDFVPVRYPLLEISSGLFVLLIVTRFGISIQSFKLVWISMVLIACCESDLLSRRIPNVILIVSIGVILLVDALALLTGVIDGLSYQWGAIALFAGVCMRCTGTLLFKRPGLGIGDIKLFTILGLYAGSLFAVTLLAAITFASLVGLVGIVSGRLRRNAQIPFAPFLTLGFVVSYFVPEPMVL
ncbi:MAG: prepilin peptidase [Rhodothermales bacterium]|nr:prepilin peptidase [Rhodothermales bacterium]